MRPTMTMAALWFVACNGKDDGSDTGADEADADTDSDTDADTDTDTDADTDADTDTDTGNPVLPPVPTLVPLSPTGGDGFYSVAFGADGSFFAAGFVADSTESTSDRAFAVAKLDSAGVLDPSFGTGGIARVNVAVGGALGELARGVVVQSTGAVVIAGAVEHDVLATGLAVADRDIAVVRLTAAGVPDDTFGPGGVRIYDLGTGIETVDTLGTPIFAGADALFGLELAANDMLLLHGATRAEGFQLDGVTPRIDTDFAVLCLTPDGVPDDTFGDQGLFTLDLGQANASARNLTLLPDGSMFGAGYANTPAFGTVQPVVFKLTAGGQLDDTFADGGVFHQEVLAEFAEAYAVAPLGTGFVTVGYGQNTADDSLDWVSLGLDASGALLPLWGDAGVMRVDPSGFSDQGRNVISLPNDRVLMVGGVSLADGASDLSWAIVDLAGIFDGGGPALHDFGGPSDMGWDAAVSPDGTWVAVVGLKGAGSENLGPANNDDAAIVRLFLE